MDKGINSKIRCGYTMAQAKKIIGNAPVRTMALDTDDPDYAALMELNRRFQEGKYSPITLISFAFSLGRAIPTGYQKSRTTAAHSKFGMHTAVRSKIDVTFLLTQTISPGRRAIHRDRWSEFRK